MSIDHEDELRRIADELDVLPTINLATLADPPPSNTWPNILVFTQDHVDALRRAADELERLRAEVARLTPVWAKERPTKAGVYLREQPNGELYAIRLEESDLRLSGFDSWYPGGRWAGPFLEPREPEVQA